MTLAATPVLSEAETHPEADSLLRRWWRRGKGKDPAATTLADLAAGQRGRIVRVDDRSIVAQRLLQLGILEGVEIEVVRRAPAGDPIEIRVLGYCLSLRRAEAALVTIEAEV